MTAASFIMHVPHFVCRKSEHVVNYIMFPAFQSHWNHDYAANDLTNIWRLGMVQIAIDSNQGDCVTVRNDFIHIVLFS